MCTNHTGKVGLFVTKAERRPKPVVQDLTCADCSETQRPTRSRDCDVKRGPKALGGLKRAPKALLIPAWGGALSGAPGSMRIRFVKAPKARFIAIPKGFRPSAQGCANALPWVDRQKIGSKPERVATRSDAILRNPKGPNPKSETNARLLYDRSHSNSGHQRRAIVVRPTRLS